MCKKFVVEGSALHARSGWVDLFSSRVPGLDVEKARLDQQDLYLHEIEELLDKVRPNYYTFDNNFFVVVVDGGQIRAKLIACLAKVEKETSASVVVSSLSGVLVANEGSVSLNKFFQDFLPSKIWTGDISRLDIQVQERISLAKDLVSILETFLESPSEDNVYEGESFNIASLYIDMLPSQTSGACWKLVGDENNIVVVDKAQCPQKAKAVQQLKIKAEEVLKRERLVRDNLEKFALNFKGTLTAVLLEKEILVVRKEFSGLVEQDSYLSKFKKILA